MSDLVFALTGVLTITLLVSSLFSLPTLWTYQVWKSASSKNRLHLLSAAYTSFWGMLYIGGLKYLLLITAATILWFSAFWLLSRVVVRYVSPSNRITFYFMTVLGRFSVLGVFEIIILVFKEDQLNRVYAELSLLVMCVLLTVVYFLKPARKD